MNKINIRKVKLVEVVDGDLRVAQSFDDLLFESLEKINEIVDWINSKKDQLL